MIVVPHDRLPTSFVARHAALRDYFCDKDAEPIETAAGWRLRLHWPGGVERHVDPRLDRGLAWWDEGVERSTMALARRREGRVLRSLYDSWTLLSWSQWLSRQRAIPTSLTILHVDDHFDLGSPRLFPAGAGWTDAISGQEVSLTNPTSVEAAIESGAIGMGSFMTPFLHVLPACDVRHLCQPPRARTTVDYGLTLQTVPDTLIAPGRERPAISLARSAAPPGPGRLRLTPDLDDWLVDIRPGPVLLHIDMDYFNNRYDGDSDWETRPDRLDPDFANICENIDAMAEALVVRDLIERLEDVVVAFSPGFFPAELWAESDARLKAGLQRLYA